MALKTFLVAAAIVCAVIFVIVTFLYLKNDNTHINQLIIYEAICSYISTCAIRDIDPEVSFDDMESYDRTWLRLWDWGYERILPKDKYKLIEPYILDGDDHGL